MIKNSEAILKEKQKAEEEERKEVSKARKTFCESFLSICLKKMSEKSSDLILPVASDKMNLMEAKVNKPLDDKLGCFLMQMQKMLEPKEINFIIFYVPYNVLYFLLYYVNAKLFLKPRVQNKVVVTYIL